MNRRTLPPLATLLALACAPTDEPGGAAYVLAERHLGATDLVYPHTDTNLAGDYAVTASSRMDFEPSGEGLWETRYLHAEAGEVTEEREEIRVAAFRVEQDTWAIVAQDHTHMICGLDEGDLLCQDISEVISRWVEQ